MLAYRCMMMATKDRYEAPYPVMRLNQYGLHELFVYSLMKIGAANASAPQSKTNAIAKPHIAG